MSFHYLTWPRLLGFGVGGVGLGLLLISGAFAGRIGPDSGDSPLEQWLFFAWIAGCALLFLLSYPLFTAREWARRVLLAVAFVVAALCTVRAVRSFFAPVSHYERLEPWIKRHMIIEDVAGTLLLVTPPVFFVLLLCHPDVVSS